MRYCGGPGISVGRVPGGPTLASAWYSGPLLLRKAVDVGS